MFLEKNIISRCNHFFHYCTLVPIRTVNPKGNIYKATKQEHRYLKEQCHKKDKENVRVLEGEGGISIRPLSKN